MPRGRIPLEELARLPNLMMVTPSYSGERLAFYWNKTGRIELYTMDLRTRQIEQLTRGEAPAGPRTGFVWTRDDRAIIFARDRDGDEQHNLFRVDLDTRKVTQLNDDPKTQEHPVGVSPDNRWLAVLSNREGQLNLFLHDLTTGEWRRLTRFASPVFGARWSPDGRWLACVTNESANLQNLDGYLVHADGSEVRRVLSVQDGSKDSIDDIHPDGRHLAVTSDAHGTDRPGILDLETGEVRWLGQEGVEEHAIRFSGDGRWLVTIQNKDATVLPVLYRVETGEARPLKLPPGFAFGARFVLGDTKLVVQMESPSRRQELLLYDIATDTYEVLLPAEYGSIDPSVFVDAEYVHYPSSDGEMVPAILYKPADLKPGERVPAIVDVHGGPTAQWFRNFNPYAQFLADQGYAVLQPNVRGSTGYGVRWRDLNLKDWGGGDLEDVAAGAQYLRSLPFVVPDRIAVMGGSYGGYMTYMAVTKKPDVFKAGIAIVGITDLRLLYQESMDHFKYYLHMLMGDPEQDRELWQDRSAITHAANLKAKLLILHGTNDPRCPISQARTFRDRLLELGRREGTDPDADFEYHEFTDEGHGPGGSTEQRLRMYRMLADFLQRRL